MILHYHAPESRYELDCIYDERDVPKSVGFQWDFRPGAKIWFTSDPRKAVRLIRYADEETRLRLLERFAA